MLQLTYRHDLAVAEHAGVQKKLFKMIRI